MLRMSRSFAALLGVLALAVSASGQESAYVVGVPQTGNDFQLELLDLSTGTSTPVGSIGQLVFGIAFSPDGRLFGMDLFNDQLLEIDPVTGGGTPVGPTGLDLIGVRGMTFDASGNLWLTGRESGIGWGFYSVDPITGAAVRLGNPGTGPLTSVGDRVLTAANGRLMEVDVETLELTPFVTPAALPSVGGDYMDMDAAATLWTWRPSAPISPPPPPVLEGVDLHRGSVVARFSSHDLVITGLAITTPLVAAPVTAVPTLSAPALVVLMILLVGFAWRRLPR